MTTQAYATNANAGTGTLVAGSAKLVVTLYQTVGTTTTVLDTRMTSVNLIAPSASITSVVLDSTTLIIDDEVGTTYDVTLQNPTGASLPNVSLQGEIIQGDAFRGAGGFSVDCPPDHVIGVLPAGSCTIVLLTANAKNTAGGGGTLVPGAASFKLTLYQDVGDTQVIFDTEIVPITPEAAPTTSTIVNVELGTTTLAISVSTPYFIGIQNPGSPLSGMDVRGEIRQGDVTASAGGFSVSCPPNFEAGVLPSGACSIAFNATAFNPLVDGPAEFVQALERAVGGITTVFDTRSTAVTLPSSST
jgi:hypothetical protein